VNTAIVRLPRGPRNNQGNEERRDPDGRRDKQCLDVAVFEGTNDGGEEVLKCLREEREMLEEDEEVDSLVGEDEVERLFDRGAGGVVCFAGVVD
jgi:hypothetical protein